MPDWRQELTNRLAKLNLEPARELEIVEELVEHLEDRYRELLQSGTAEADAQRTALDELCDGSLLFDELKQCERKADPETSTWGRHAGSPKLANLWQDLRYCLRLMRRNPGFTGGAVVTLTLGIGATIAIFGVVNGILVRPLPYDKADELVVFVDRDSARDQPSLDATSPPVYRSWRARNRVFQDIALFYRNRTEHLTGSGEPERLTGCNATAAMFGVLRARPAFGRLYTEGEDMPGGARVVILSDALWRRRFQADRNILGRTLILSDRSYTVIGVMPPDFRFPAQETEFWTPLNVEMFKEYNAPTARYVETNLVARLRPGITCSMAEADIDNLIKQQKKEFPSANDEPDKKLLPLREYLVGSVRPILLLLMGAVIFVLLVACANVANLLLIRSESRRKEMAVRMALGASVSRMIRQALAESLLLSLFGGAGGLLLGYWAAKILVRMAPPRVPRLDQVGLDVPMLVSAVAAVFLCTLLVGFWPAIRAAKSNVSDTIKEGGSGTATGRGLGRKAIVVFQMTLAMILLSGAGLMIRSVVYLLQLDLGFDARNVVTFRLDRPLSKEYKDNFQLEWQRRVAFFNQVIENIRPLPGVISVGGTSSPPLSETVLQKMVAGGTGKSSKESEIWTNPYWVTPDYFEVMGIHLLRGRRFTDADAGWSSRVVIIDATLAERFWPGQDPIGKRMKEGGRYPQYGEWMTVVGVVPLVRRHGLKADPAWAKYPQQVYFALHPTPVMTIAVRTQGDPLKLVDVFRQEVWKLDKSQPVSKVVTMESMVSDFSAEPRFYMSLLTVFAVIALVLAAVGIYGVTGYWVTQRSREIGVRMAMGAQAGNVVRLVLRQGLILTLGGLLLGLAGAFTLTRFLSGMIYGLTATDPVAFAGVSLALAAASAAALLIPARRATRVDPIRVLRSE